MFKKISKPTRFLIFFLIASFLVISSGVLITKAAQIMNSYRLDKNNGTNITAINPWDLNAIGRGCQTVTNSSGNDFFVPAQNAAEWDAFVAHLPSGVAATGVSCVVGCTAGYYLSGASCVSCPTNTTSVAGATSINNCTCIQQYNNPYTGYYRSSYNCNNNINDGCEVVKTCDSLNTGCPRSQQAACGYCGDGYCASQLGDESQTTCYADCGSCGDGICNTTYEGPWGCYADCGGDVCSDQSACTGYSNSYCSYYGFSGGECDRGYGYCNGCQNDQYNCDSCGSWVVQQMGKCVCW